MRQIIIIFKVLPVLLIFIMNSCEKESVPNKTVEQITISPEVLALKTGETAILQAVIIPADAGPVTWSSNMTSVAAVDGEGQVIAGGIAGIAVITAFAGDKSATCMVTVTEEQEVVYPLFHAIDVVINIVTTETFPSDKDPAPKHESTVQISGTLIGKAVMGRIESIVTDPDAWGELAQYGTTPVLTSSSELKIRDENDFTQYSLIRRYPLTVSINRTEMDYIMFEEGERYTKVYDFLAEGKNTSELVDLDIVPYFPTNQIPPLIPHYAVDLSILRYVEYVANAPLGNGHSLRWDYNSEQLEPTGDPLYMSVVGTYTDIDPEAGIEPVLISRDELNTFFMNTTATQLVLELVGSSYTENYSKRQQTITVKLDLSPVPNVLALPFVN